MANAFSLKFVGKTCRRFFVLFCSPKFQMAESEEELRSFLMKVKEESEKAGLKFNTEKTKIMASGPIT